MNTTKYNGIFTTHDMDTAMTSGYGICDGIGIGFGCGIRARIKLLDSYLYGEDWFIRVIEAPFSYSLFAHRILIVEYNTTSWADTSSGRGLGCGVYHRSRPIRVDLGLVWCNGIIPAEVAINEIHT